MDPTHSAMIAFFAALDVSRFFWACRCHHGSSVQKSRCSAGTKFDSSDPLLCESPTDEDSIRRHIRCGRMVSVLRGRR